MPSTAGAIRAGRAYVELFAEDSKLVRGLHRAQRKLQAFGKSVLRIGGMMAGVAAAIAVPFAIAVKRAGSAVETINKFKVVFKDQAKAAEAFANTLAKSVGRSRFAIMDAMASLHAFFIGLGFGAVKARELAEEIESLSIDFASLYELPDAEAFQKILTALAGRPRSVREYGINVMDSAVATEALAMGLKKGTKALTQQEKVLARISILVRTLTEQGVVGDAVRTAKEFTNRMKALRAAIYDASVDIGLALLPAVTDYVDKMVKAAHAVGAFLRENKEVTRSVVRVVVVFGLAGVALMALGLIIIGVGAGLSGLATILATIAAVLGAILSPVALVTASLVILGIHILEVTGAGGKALKWLGERFADLKADAVAAWTAIGEALAAGDVALAARILWLTLEMEWVRGINALEGYWLDFKTSLLNTMTDAKAGIRLIWLDIVSAIKEVWAGFTRWLKRDWEGTQTVLAKLVVDIWGIFDWGLDTKAVKKQIDESSAQRLAMGDQALAATKKQIEAEKKAETKKILDEAKAEKAADKTVHDKRMEQLKEEVKAARAQLKELLAAAKAGGEAGGAVVGAARAAAAAAAAAVAERITAFGMVGAWGVRGGGTLAGRAGLRVELPSTDIETKQLRQLEGIRTNTAKTAAQLAAGVGLTE